MEDDMAECINCKWLDDRMEDMHRRMTDAAEKRNNSAHEEASIGFEGFYSTWVAHDNRYHKNITPGLEDEVTR